MVPRIRHGVVPTRRTLPRVSTPLFWRVLMAIDRGFVALTGKLEVSGDVPPELLGKPLLLASNHIGNLDPFVLIVEGSVPDEKNKEAGCWAGFGTDRETGQPIPTCDWN